MHIIENLAPPELAEHLVHTLYSPEFPWFYHHSTLAVTKENVVPGYSDSNTVERPQFSHSFIRDGEPLDQYWSLIEPLLGLLTARTGYTPSKVLRVKANLLLKDSTYPVNAYHEPHVDTNIPCGTSMIYYVDSSDGDTHFFNEYLFGPDFTVQQHQQLTKLSQFTPTRGSAVVFASDRYHASSSPVLTDRRIVINFVLAD